ncbi:MAG: hypothetical protein ACI849_001312, partial [Patiriisocius sp.]
MRAFSLTLFLFLFQISAGISQAKETPEPEYIRTIQF